MSLSLTLEGLVLRRVDFGEADRVVTLLTPDRGRIAAFAAGARKSKRRFAGALEPFTRLTAQMSPGRRGDLWRLEDVQVLDGHGPLRDSLEAMACASVACELASGLAVEGGVPHAGSGLYEIVVAFLRTLVGDPTRTADLYRFALLALQASGVRPSFRACARCGEACGDAVQGALPEGLGVEHFDPSEGGRLCVHCGPRSQNARRVPAWLFRALQSFEVGDQEFPPAGRSLLWAYAQHQLGKPMKSLALLADLGL